MGAEKSSYVSNFEGKWKDKTLIFNIDPSAVIGVKRSYARNHLKKHVYKGIT